MACKYIVTLYPWEAHIYWGGTQTQAAGASRSAMYCRTLFIAQLPACGKPQNVCTEETFVFHFFQIMELASITSVSHATCNFSNSNTSSDDLKQPKSKCPAFERG